MRTASMESRHRLLLNELTRLLNVEYSNGPRL